MSKETAKNIIAAGGALVLGAGYVAYKTGRLFKKPTATTATVVPLEKTDDCWAADAAKPVTETTANVFVKAVNKLKAVF